MASRVSFLDAVELSDFKSVREGAGRAGTSFGNGGAGSRGSSKNPSANSSGFQRFCVKLLGTLVFLLSIALSIVIWTHPKLHHHKSAPEVQDVGSDKLDSSNEENVTYWYTKAQEWRVKYQTELVTREGLQREFDDQAMILDQETEKREKLEEKLAIEKKRLGIFDIPVIIAIGGVSVLGYLIDRYYLRGIKEPEVDESRRVSLLSSHSVDSGPFDEEATEAGVDEDKRVNTEKRRSSSSTVSIKTDMDDLSDVLNMMQNSFGRKGSLEADLVLKEKSTLTAMQELWAELFPENMQGFMDNVGAGIVTGTKFTTGMVAFSVLLYGSCEELEKHMPMGIKSNLWSCVVSQTLYCLLGGLPYGMALPQDIPCLLLGRMGAQLPQLVPAEKIIPTYMLLVSCQALMCSLLFFISYVSGLSKIVMQLPSSLLAGFVFGNGLGLLRAAGKQLTRVDWKYLWPDPAAIGVEGCTGFECLKSKWVFLHVLVGIFNFLCILMLAPRIKSRLLKGRPSCCTRLVAAFASPFAMLCCIPPFYLAMRFGWFAMEDAQKHEWLADPEPNPWDMRFWRFWFIFYDFKDQDLSVIVHFLPDMFSVSVISLIEAAMGGCSVEATCPRHKPLDLGLELRAHAVENLVVGLTGGTTVFLQTGMTINAHRTDGATHRIAGLVASSLCLTVFITGVPIATYAPRFMPGAVFLVVGYIMVKDAAIETFATMPLQEWLGILVIGFIFMIHGMEAAMIWGLFYAVFLFMAQSSAQSVVKDVTTADKSPSSRERPVTDRRILNRRRKQILVIAFRGCIFWGSVRELMDLLLPHLGGEKVKYIVFDLREIQRVDGSACKALLRIVRLGGFQKVKFCFIVSEKAAQVEANLQNGNLILCADEKANWDPSDWPSDDDRCPYFDAYDDCIAFCEDAILAGHKSRSCASPTELACQSEEGGASEPPSPAPP